MKPPTKNQRASNAESIMKNRGLGKMNGHEPLPGIPNGLRVHVQRPSGRGISGVSDVATGKWDAQNGKWVFQSKEDSLQRWLEDTFAQAVIGRAGLSTGSTTLPIGSIAYLQHMRDAMLPRKGLMMDWKIEKEDGK